MVRQRKKSFMLDGFYVTTLMPNFTKIHYWFGSLRRTDTWDNTDCRQLRNYATDNAKCSSDSKASMKHASSPIDSRRQRIMEHWQTLIQRVAKRRCWTLNERFTLIMKPAAIWASWPSEFFTWDVRRALMLDTENLQGDISETDSACFFC
jgi:hypothetical protein